MNFFGAFQSEVFKPLVTLLIPGAVAISSWFVALCWKFPSLKTLVSNNHTDTAWVLLFVTIAVGFIIENWGARIEDSFDRSANKISEGEHFKQWFAYLRTCFESDPVGRRYMRTLVLRIKFELGMTVGLWILSGGIIWLMFLGVDCATALILLTASLGLSLLQYVESNRTHALLARTRSELLKSLRVVSGTNPHPPIDEPAPAHKP